MTLSKYGNGMFALFHNYWGPWGQDKLHWNKLQNFHITKFFMLFRAEDKVELRHTLEGHALGVVSVDMNIQGTSILIV